MVLDPYDVNASAETLWGADEVFCTLCERLVPKDEAKGFPEVNPKEWVCFECIIGDIKKEDSP